MTQEHLLTEKSKVRLLFLLLLTYGVGFFIMAFLQTPIQMEWYDTLAISAFTPPDITFSIVWTILYALISVAAWLVWDKGGRGYYYAQLVAQIAWSFTFFVAHWMWGGLFILLCLCLLVALMIIRFYHYSKMAALLLIPYFIWLVFASYLNLATAYLN